MSDYDTWEEEAPAKEVTKEAPIAPPKRNQGSVDLGPLPSNLMSTLKPGVLNVPEPVSTTELAKDVKNAQETVGAPQAANPLDQLNLKKHMHDFVESDAFLPSVIAAGLGATALIGKHLSNKPKSTAERDIRRIESEMDVNKQASNGRVEPTLEPETAHIGTNAEKVLNTAQGMPHLISEAEPISNVLGIPNERTGLNKPKLSVVENAPALEPINDPAEMARKKQIAARQAQQKIIDQTPQIKDAIIAPNAGITSDTSPQEADTLANVSEASKTPEEKVKTELEKGLTKEGAVIPEGRIPNYMEFKTKKGGTKEYKNKQGSDVIGKGGWNWYQGQMGPEAEENWLHQFGRTNQTYKDVTQAVKEGRLKGPEVTSEGKGGTFSREPHVPNYIKGAASLGEMAAMAGLPLGALGLYHAYQHGKETGDYTDLGMGGVDLASSALGRAAIPLAFATHMENAGAPVLPPRILEAQRQAKLLGSPYRNAK